jgi:dTDP-glucose 4,6-dehydratase
MNRLLVTGGAGFIGSNFCEYWMDAYPQDRLIVLDALTYAGNLANLEALTRRGLRFVRGDIGDTPDVLSLLMAEGIDTIVNFAAETHVDRSINDPQAFVRTNVLGTEALLEAARVCAGDCPGFRFHHVSTDEVFGTLSPEAPPFTEQHPYAPRSPYAASKAAADHLVRAYGTTYGLAYTLSNCSNNYGPRQYPEKLLPLFILNLLAGRPLPVYGDGLQVRDWLHVRDHCRAIDLILRRGSVGETYNIGGGSELQNLRIVQRLCALVDAHMVKDTALSARFPDCPAARGIGCQSLIQFVRDRPGHDRRYAIDGRKIERELGFRPEVTLEDGLAMTLKWYLDHERWWRDILARGEPAAVLHSHPYPDRMDRIPLATSS